MSDNANTNIEEISWQEFLVERPPGRAYQVPVNSVRHRPRPISYSTDEIQSYCERCEGIRCFFCDDGGFNPSGREPQHATLEYCCQNCVQFRRIFAVFGSCPEASHYRLFKLGEHPSFGPPVPPQVIELIKPDRDIYLQGRRAESQGMGIGAYAYYRRVVEKQKDRLFQGIIDAVRNSDTAGDDQIERLERARVDFQFNKSISDFKGLIPPALLIRGHNPFSLLHDALSKGIHTMSDAECLERARSIRVVLTVLAERLTYARKDQSEVNAAIKTLTSPPAPT